MKRHGLYHKRKWKSTLESHASGKDRWTSMFDYVRNMRQQNGPVCPELGDSDLIIDVQDTCSCQAHLTCLSRSVCLRFLSK